MKNLEPYRQELAKFQKDGEALGLSFSEKQLSQFITYYEMLVEKNKVMNLTGITELSEVLQKHFIDSLSICQAAAPEQLGRVLDLGTGAGFPGIPLKILFPHLEITLLDSLKKRLVFLDEVIEKLGLEKITTLHGRAEDYAQKIEYRETYSLCVSRAVANLATLSEYCLPYVTEGGSFISYKSGKIEEELAEAKKAVYLLGGEIESSTAFCLPGSEIERTLVTIRKKRKTPKKYPRKAGLPAKEPLK